MATREETAVETICVPVYYLHELEKLKEDQEDDDGTTKDEPGEVRDSSDSTGTDIDNGSTGGDAAPGPAELQSKDVE